MRSRPVAGPGEPQGAHRGLGAGVDEPDLLDRRDQSTDELRQIDTPAPSAPRSSFRGRAGRRQLASELPRGVAMDQRAPGHHVVDVAVAVLVLHLGSAGAGHEGRRAAPRPQRRGPGCRRRREARAGPGRRAAGDRRRAGSGMTGTNDIMSTVAAPDASWRCDVCRRPRHLLALAGDQRLRGARPLDPPLSGVWLPPGAASSDHRRDRRPLSPHLLRRRPRGLWRLRPGGAAPPARGPLRGPAGRAGGRGLAFLEVGCALGFPARGHCATTGST